jgi:hypothetical protein
MDSVVLTSGVSVPGTTLKPDWAAKLVAIEAVFELLMLLETDMFQPPYPYPELWMPADDSVKAALVEVPVAVEAVAKYGFASLMVSC